MAEDTPKRFTSAGARQKAEECRSLEKRVSDPSHRAMLRLMADTWEQMAADISKRGS
jgi:hypothetical protein